MLKLKYITNAQNQLDSILGSFYNYDYNTKFYDIIDNNDNYQISIDLPGYTQKEIEIELENGYLNVRAKNEKRGQIEKSINLGREIGDKISAKLENGVLNLIIEKQSQLKKKKIDII